MAPHTHHTMLSHPETAPSPTREMKGAQPTDSTFWKKESDSCDIKPLLELKDAAFCITSGNRTLQQE